MPNISETVRETFIKLLGFFGVVPMILCAKYGGDLAAQFLGEEVGKLKLSPLISPKWEVPGTRILLCSWRPLSTQK